MDRRKYRDYQIREMRQRAGLTQVQAAELLGLTEGAYGTYEREERRITIDNAFDMCDVFGCSIYELVGREEKQCHTPK